MEMKIVGKVSSGVRGDAGLVACFRFDLRWVERRAGLLRLLLLATAGDEVVPRVYSLLPRLLEVLGEFLLSLLRLLFVDFLFALSLPLLLVAHVELLSLALHVGEELHHHHVLGVRILLGIVLVDFDVVSTFLLQLFALLREVQVRSLLCLLKIIESMAIGN